MGYRCSLGYSSFGLLQIDNWPGWMILLRLPADLLPAAALAAWCSSAQSSQVLGLTGISTGLISVGQPIGEFDTLFQIGLFSNKAMVGSVLLTFVLQLAVIYVPFLNRAFSTTPLSLRDLLISLGFSVIVFFAVEFFKWIRQRVKPKRSK